MAISTTNSFTGRQRMIGFSIIHTVAGPLIKVLNELPQRLRQNALQVATADAARAFQIHWRGLVRKEALGIGLNTAGKPRPHLWKGIIISQAGKKGKPKSLFGAYAAIGYSLGGDFQHRHFVEFGTVPHKTPQGKGGNAYPDHISAGTVAAAIFVKSSIDLFKPIWIRFNIHGKRFFNHPGSKGHFFAIRTWNAKKGEALRRFRSKLRQQVPKELKRVVLKMVRKQHPGQKVQAHISSFTPF